MFCFRPGDRPNLLAVWKKSKENDLRFDVLFLLLLHLSFAMRSVNNVGREFCASPNRFLRKLTNAILFYYSFAQSQAGICCLNMECCAKMGAPCLFPFGCVGVKPECDGCSVINAQCHTCCLVVSAAVPCNEEVPVAVSIAGLTVFPKFGCCIRQKEIMNRD